jgi:hypothetical protein
MSWFCRVYTDSLASALWQQCLDAFTDRINCEEFIPIEMVPSSLVFMCWLCVLPRRETVASKGDGWAHSMVEGSSYISIVDADNCGWLWTRVQRHGLWIWCCVVVLPSKHRTWRWWLFAQVKIFVNKNFVQLFQAELFWIELFWAISGLRFKKWRFLARLVWLSPWRCLSVA